MDWAEVEMVHLSPTLGFPLRPSPGRALGEDLWSSFDCTRLAPFLSTRSQTIGFLRRSFIIGSSSRLQGPAGFGVGAAVIPALYGRRWGVSCQSRLVISYLRRRLATLHVGSPFI